MNALYLGISLIVAGGILLFLGLRRSRRPSVSASHGSVAAGGNVSGSITNTNTNLNRGAAEQAPAHTLTVVAIFVEIAGICVTIWHALHMARK